MKPIAHLVECEFDRAFSLFLLLLLLLLFHFCLFVLYFHKFWLFIIWLILLLLSMNAHNHVDDYSGTLGGVRKVHISALVTSPKNWVVALSLRHSLSVSQQTKQNKTKNHELVDWSFCNSDFVHLIFTANAMLMFTVRFNTKLWDDQMLGSCFFLSPFCDTVCTLLDFYFCMR